MPALAIAGLSKTYANGVVGLRPTDLSVSSGETLALLGPSGSGKSTLLRLIAGLESPDSGTVELDGVRIDTLPPHRRGVAMLAQKPALYPHLTVAKNLAVVGPKSRDAIDLLRLEPLLDRLPHELSGGERQRVGLAKLLVRNAALWLLDEPFAGLDPTFRPEFRLDLHLLARQAGATILLVTHDPTDATALGHRIGVVGDGRLVQVGPADELIERPATAFVAGSLGRFSLVPGAISTRAGGGDRSERVFVSECGSVEVPVPADEFPGASPPPASLTLGIRPTDVSPVPPDFAIPEPGIVLKGWPVVLAEPDGSGWLLTLARGRTRVRCAQQSGPPLPVGVPADWYIPANAYRWFAR